MRLRSCENRFVTTPVSVFVKKERGARMRVRKASWCKRAPALFTEETKRIIPRRSSEIMALIWSKA
jgi:hypothetical protein